MRKTVNILILFLAGVLAILPIIFWGITEIGGVAIMDGERFIIQ